MIKNLVDNLLVSVEFKQIYKLLFVCCLLDQKIFLRNTIHTIAR